MNRSLTLKTGQTHVHRYLKIDPSFVITHRMRLDDAPDGYEIFKHKEDECIKIVLRP
jgi:threonine dehydrogenase-like Zn-dependent dehydrogenase